MKSKQSLLQTVFAKFWSTPTLSNGTTFQIGIIPLTLELISWVKGLHFSTISRFPFVPYKDVINNIKHGVNQLVTIEYTVSVATCVQKQTTTVPSICAFDKFSSYQKYLRIAAYALRFLPKHAGYHNLDGSITDPTVLDKTECHLQYLVQSLLKPKGKIFSIINLLNYQPNCSKFTVP